MGDKSGIEWTEATWNPATGCTKVSAGCKFCYAKHKAWPRLAGTKNSVYFGRAFEDVQVHPERLDQPLRWRKPRRIFVNSMSDLFHEAIPDSFIASVFEVMQMAPQHTFQVLTKRPGRMLDFMSRRPLPGKINGDQLIAEKATGWPPSNVWLGVSVENQETCDERVPLLLKTKAAVRWLSCEPLIGPVDIRAPSAFERDRLSWLRHLDWVVVGGESGKGARPMDRTWAMDIRYWCQKAGVPFFMKQGSQANWPHWKDMSRWLPQLRVREYPK